MALMIHSSEQVPPRRFLVLGGSSFVGHHLYAARRRDDTVLSTYRTHRQPDMVRYDSCADSIDDIVYNNGPFDHAVILLGDTQPDSCIADPARSREINVDSIIRLIDRLCELGIRPVFTSSEFVFDGAKGNYLETDAAEPILLYGAQKLEVERHLESRCDDFTILRLAKIYGLEPGDDTLFTRMLDMIASRVEAPCAADQRFSPVWVGDVVAAILAAMDLNLPGTYHVAGPVGMSRLELLKLLMAEANKYRPVDFHPKPCSIHDFNLPEKRPLDVSMRPDKLARVSNLDFMHPAEACRKICKNAFQNQSRMAT
jgi:dTDP-4-dehydrorhamnose reductase